MLIADQPMPVYSVLYKGLVAYYIIVINLTSHVLRYAYDKLVYFQPQLNYVCICFINSPLAAYLDLIWSTVDHLSPLTFVG